MLVYLFYFILMVYRIIIISCIPKQLNISIYLIITVHFIMKQLIINELIFIIMQCKNAQTNKIDPMSIVCFHKIKKR